MLEPEDYIVITKANNGYIVTLNNDTDPDEDRQPHVFTDVSDLVEHMVRTLSTGGSHGSTQ